MSYATKRRSAASWNDATVSDLVFCLVTDAALRGFRAVAGTPPLPRFYFQLTDGMTRIADSNGQVFADAAAAREHATACTEAFSRRVAKFNGNDGLYWRVQVLDEHGSQVFTQQLAQPARAVQSSSAAHTAGSERGPEPS